MTSTAIYMLHRVLPKMPNTPPDNGMSITCAEFEAFLMSKKDKKAQNLKDWPHNAHKGGYILTFDDGYKDNLEHALPLLEKYNVPATIFITTGFIDGNIYPLERPLWTALQDKHKYESQRHNLKNGSYHQRLQILKRITGDSAFNVEDNLFLNWDELKALSQHPLITIGAHSHTHPNLARSSLWAQWKELWVPRKIFEKQLGYKPDLLAYPYGGNSAITRTLSKLAGYKIALGTINKAADEHSDIFRLPRLDIMEAVQK